MMTPKKAVPPRRTWTWWTGWTLTAIPIALLLLSATMKLLHPPEVLALFTGKLGFDAGILTGLAILELACALLYAIPRTSFLGAILLTGYLGGAIVSHVRIGDAGFVTPLVLGIFVWAGLYLRESRLRALNPMLSPVAG